MVRRFEAFDMETAPLSKSGILSYKQCPWRFKRMVIDKVPGVPSDVMEIGTWFHDDVEKLYDRIDKEAITTGKTTVSDEYAKYLPADQQYVNFINIEQTRFDSMKKMGTLADFFPLHRELYLKDEVLQYYGTLDRVDKDGGDYAVLDYKFSSYPKHQSAFSKHRLELAGYAHLVNVSKLLPKPVRFIGIIFVGETPGVFYEPLKPISIAAFHRNLLSAREGIQAGIFDKKRGFQCQWCPYDLDCTKEEAAIGDVK